MCSLNVLPTVGSNVTVHITRVNLHPHYAFVEFGGNFNPSQLMGEIYQRMRKEIQISKKTAYDFEGEPGDLCLVEEEEIWHRARILSRCGKKYNVFLIDDGRTLWVHDSILAWGQSVFFNLPPMMELFMIASVSALCLQSRWSPTASEFIRSLSGRTVCGCVQDVMMPYRIILLDIPSVFKEMLEFGFAKKIPSEEFQTLVLNSLHSYADICHTSPSSTLTNNKTGHARNFEKFTHYLFPELLPGTVETVEVTQVVNPLIIFCRLHVFTHELKKLNQQIEEYYESTPAAETTRPLSHGSPCATKGSDGKWYRSVLQQNIASDLAKVFHVDYGIRDVVKVGDIRPLSMNFFKLPVVTYACSLYGLTNKHTIWTTGQIEHLKSVLLNQTFVGKFEHQNMSDGFYHVTLYGNDNVNINDRFAVHEKSIFTPERPFSSPVDVQIQKKHKETCKHKNANPIDCLGYRSCSNDSVAFKNTKMPEPASPAGEINRRLTLDIYQCKVESVIDEHLFTVGSVLEVKVSYVENDQKFWGQMACSVPSLKMLMEDIQRHYSCSKSQLPTGLVCVARHPENAMWYRARILKQHLTPYVDVRLIDYGQLLKVPLLDLRPIDPQFLKLTCQAFQCSLFHKINTESSETRALNDSGLSESFDFNSPALSCNISLKCTIRAVMFDAQGVVLNLVDIEALSQNVLFTTELNISEPNPLATSCVLNDMHAVSVDQIEVGSVEKIRITCVEGVNNFYGQLKQNAAMVEEMTNEIQQYCATGQQPRYSFSPQMMCLARYYGGQWHRGEVKSVRSKMTVHFVDYGDVLVLDDSDVLPFPAQHSAIMSIPFQAVQFKLFNVTLEESSELNKWFEKHAIDCTFTATVIGKSRSGRLSVELHDGKTNINVKVKEKWKEIQKKKHTKQEPNMMSPKLMEQSWRIDHSNYRHQVHIDTRNNKQIEDASCFTSPQDDKRKCTDLASCKSGLLISQDVEHEHIKYVASNFPTQESLPSKNIKERFVSEVYVSHCSSPSNFFVQLVSEENDICCLVDKLNSSQLFEEVDFNQLQSGHLVKAEYALDGAWYRAVVKDKLEDCTIQVEFIDYGNEAKLSVSKVKQLDLEFLKFPRYSIHCCLTGVDGVEWTQEQIDTFANGEKLLFSFINENASVWHVNIEGQGKASLLKMDMESTLKINSGTTLLNINSENICPGEYKKPEIILGQTIGAYASSIAGPNYFWCQYADSENLEKISEIAQDTGSSAQTSLISLDSLSPGDTCLALFPEDNRWYRAQVINKSMSLLSVLFIDYGNESELFQNSVKAVPKKLLEVPPQAFLCQLEGFKPTEGCWNDAAAVEFSGLIIDKLLKVIVQNVEITPDISNRPQFHVLVECNTGCVNDIMKDYWTGSYPGDCGHIPTGGVLNPMALTLSGSDLSPQSLPKLTDLPPMAIQQDFVFEVYVSHINSLSSFFVQLAKDESSLMSLTEELNSTYLPVKEDQINSVSHGCLVKAVFPDDNSWYRAVIKDTNGKDIHVEFIDFGNEATISATNVRKLDEQFLQFPRFSIHCSLTPEDCASIQKGIDEGTCPLRKVLGKIGEKRLFCRFINEYKTVWEVKVADQRTMLQSLGHEKWDDLDISLLQDATSEQLKSQVIPLSNTFSSPFKRPKYSVGQTLEAYASSIRGPHYFWCQHANSEELDKISLIAQETGNSEQTDLITHQWRLGDACIALFNDEMWYRAQIIKKSPITLSVLFVDFGNEFEVLTDNIRPLPLSLVESPLQAFLCQLEGFNLSEGSWNENAIDTFCELVVDKPLNVTIKKIQNMDSPPSYHVRVQSEDIDVNEHMKCFWTTAIHAYDESLRNTNSVQSLSNASSSTVNGHNELLDKALENISTSATRPQCSSTFGREDKGETPKQNVDSNEELVESEFTVKENPATATDVNITSIEEASLNWNYVSEITEELSRTSHKHLQTRQLNENLFHVGMSKTASSHGSDQQSVTQDNSDVPNAQADVGYSAKLEGIY
ncbi:tudor domain-containing 6 [Hoplias malabaricus]|uniref:tudor domain-containing 6 n=1 Tax=Hoplias malabaricus TaxID=27720 RepID=UPI003463311C